MRSKTRLLMLTVLVFFTSVETALAACITNTTDKEPLIFIIDCTLTRTACTKIKQVQSYERFCYDGVGFAMLKKGKGTSCNKVRMQTNDTEVKVSYNRKGELRCKARRKSVPADIIAYMDNGRNEYRAKLTYEETLPKLKKNQEFSYIYYLHPDKQYDEWKIELFKDEQRINTLRLFKQDNNISKSVLALKKGENYTFKVVHRTGNVDVNLFREIKAGQQVWTVFENGPVFTSETEAKTAYKTLFVRAIDE